MMQLAVVNFKTKNEVELFECGLLAVAHRQESKLVPAFWSRE